MQNFQRSWEVQTSAGSKAKGVISGVGKGIVGVFTKPIGGAAELVSQTGYGEFGTLGHGRFLLLCCHEKEMTSSLTPNIPRVAEFR